MRIGDYDKLVKDLKEEPLRFIVPDNAGFYVSSDWAEGEKLFHQLAEQNPDYVVEQKLGEYTFGKITVETENENVYTFDEKAFLLTVVQAADRQKAIARVGYRVYAAKDGLTKEEAKEAWGLIERAWKREMRTHLPDSYSIWAYTVRHPKAPSEKYVFLLGGIDGPSEPGGTAAYANLVWKLINDPEWQPLLAKYSFCILPNANPLSSHRYSPYGEGGIHLIPDEQWGYEIIRDFPSGNIGSVFDQEDNPSFEIRMVKKWVSQIDSDRIIGFVSQHGTFRGACALVSSPAEKKRVYPTLKRWSEYMKVLGIPLNPEVKTIAEGKEILGVGIGLPLGVPSGYFSNRGIFGMLVECGNRSDPANMANSTRTVISAVLAVLCGYENIGK